MENQNGSIYEHRLGYPDFQSCGVYQVDPAGQHPLDEAVLPQLGLSPKGVILQREPAILIVPPGSGRGQIPGCA